MSGSGYRNRGFGSHGAHYNINNNNSGPAGGRDDGVRGSAHGYQRGTYNSSTRRDNRPNDDWSQSRRFTQWGEQQIQNTQPHRNDQQSWTPQNRGHFHNEPMRFQYRGDGSFKPRGGTRGFFPRGHGFSRAPRGHRGFFSPYYSAPFRENSYDQHDKEPEEPVPPLLGSEEERQQKITDIAAELKKKMSTRNTANDETNYWNDNSINFPSSPGRTVDSFVIRPLPELMHGPPELNLTANDLKDIGRIDAASTIDPLVTDFSSDLFQPDEFVVDSEMQCENSDDVMIVNAENNENSVPSVNKIVETVSVNSSQKVSHIRTESSSSEITLKNLPTNSAAASISTEEHPINAVAQTCVTDSELHSLQTTSGVSEVESAKTLSNLTSSRITEELSDISLPTDWNPINIPPVTSSETLTTEVREKSTVEESREQEHEQTTTETNKSKREMKKNNRQKRASKFLPVFPVSETEILQPPAAFDPRRRETILTTIVPEFTHQPTASFNAHLTSIPPIIPSAPIVASMTGFAMGHSDYSTMTSFVPAVPMTYAPVINPAEYASQQLIQSSQQHMAANICSPLECLEENLTPQLNEDEALGDLKAAMEFAMESMKMESPVDDIEEAIEFPTFPDLPPVKEEPVQLSKTKVTPKKTTKTKKKYSQEIYGPCPNPEEPVAAAAPDLITSCVNNTEEIAGDDLGRPKVVFNLNSKVKKLSKTDDWADSEPLEEISKLRQRKFIPISSSISTIPENLLVIEKARIEEKIKEVTKLINSSELNNHKKDSKKESKTRVSGTERRESNNKLHGDKKIEYVQKKSSQISPTSVHKPEKNAVSENTIIDITSSPKNSSSQKIPAKTPGQDPTWEEKVIRRFVKMKPAAIQNVINSSSLKKFDIAMQHLVKEKKSSLSLEQRTNQDEKMKNSTYDGDNFMYQLKAILATAETVDTSNLPTTFIHQLSEVLQLDSPLLDPPIHKAEKGLMKTQHNNSTIVSHEEPSTSSKIDQPVTSEAPRCIGSNAPAISSREMSKSRKIDTKASKDTVRNTMTTVNACSTRTKGKRTVEVEPSIIPRATIDLTSAPSTHANPLNVDVPNDMLYPGGTRLKTTKQPIVNKSSFLEAVTPPEQLSPMTSRIETPIVVRAERQRSEVDNIFADGIAKAREASMKAAAAASIEVAQHITRSRRVARRGMPRGTDANMAGTWRRKCIDDPDNYRNLTKEEYEAKFGESSNFAEHEYRRLGGLPPWRGIVNGRQTTTHLTHMDKAYYTISPPQLQSHSKTNESESDGSYSSRGSDSTSGSSSNTSSDEESQSKKNREKKIKKRIDSDEFREEVNAEIERRRKEKSLKHRSHKSRPKKREKRKKEKKGKKRKPKKKRRHRSSHHSQPSSEDRANENERPLRLLRDDEIKREPKENEDVNEPPKITQTPVRGKKTVTEPILVAKATSTFPSSPIVPTIISSSTSVTSTITTMPSANPTLSIAPNTLIANVKVSNIVKTGLRNTATSPLRTITCNSTRTTSPASTTQHPKTKAQLKQMPEALTSPPSHEIQTKIEPVSSSCYETQISPSDSSSTSLSQQSPSISTTAVMSTSSGPKKLDIKAYHERAQQRKLQEQVKKNKSAENSSLQTQEPSIQQVKTELIIAAEASKVDDTVQTILQPNISENISNTSIIPTSTVANAAQSPEECSAKDVDSSDSSKISVLPVRQKLRRACKSIPTATETENITSEENKFINIKSEGGKELKLKEKVKKRPGKSTKIPVLTDAIKIEPSPIKVTPSTPLGETAAAEQPENADEIVKNESVEAINDSIVLSRVSFAEDSVDMDGANSSSEMETDLINAEAGESTKKINDLAIEQMEFDSVSSLENISELKQNMSIIKMDIRKEEESNLNYSHYFCFIKSLISDDLPDTVAQETMDSQPTIEPDISPQHQIIEDNNVSEIITTQILPSTYLPREIDKSLLINDEINLLETVSISEPDVHEDIINSQENSLINSPIEIKETIEHHNQAEEHFKDNIESPNAMAPSDVSNSQINNENILSSPAVISEIFNAQLNPSLSSLNLDSEIDSPELSLPMSSLATTDEQFVKNRDSSLLQPELSNSPPLYDESPTTHNNELTPQTLSNSEFIPVSPKEIENDNLVMETAAICETEENALLNCAEANISDWHQENIDDDKASNKLQQDEAIEESPISLDSGICYKEFHNQPIVLHDRILAAENPTNSFLDDPVVFSSGSKSPTTEVDQYSINDGLTEKIYENHELAEEPAIADDEEISNTFEATHEENSCLPSPQADNNRIESPSIPDKELIKVVKETSPEPLPLPILQVSSKFTEKDTNTEKDDVVIDKLDKVVNTDDHTEDIIKIVIAEAILTDNQPISPSSTSQILEIPSSTTQTNEPATISAHGKYDRSPEERLPEREMTPQQELSSSNANVPQTEIHRLNKDRDLSRKSSRSKSATPTQDLKKHKKHHHRDKKKPNSTLQKREVVAPTNTVTVVSKATTKDAVLARMQEIDLTMQRLLEEKMNLYNLLKTDKWPVNQSVEPSVALTIIEKSSDKPSSEKLQPTKPAKVSVTRDSSNSKQSSVTESVSTKSERSNTPKHNTNKPSKVVKNDYKRSRNQEEQASKTGKKRKHHDEKPPHKIKILRREESPEIKKKKPSKEPPKVRHRHKSPFKSMKATEEPTRTEKAIEQSAPGIKSNEDTARVVKAEDSSHKSMKSETSASRELKAKSRRAIFSDSSDESQTPDNSMSGDISVHGIPKIVPAENHTIIYSDDSSADAIDSVADYPKRSSALSMLEESVNREIAAKKAKNTRTKTKLSKISDDENEDITPSELMSKKKQQRKKQSLLKKSSKIGHVEATEEHVLEIIDAVAKNIKKLDTIKINKEKRPSNLKNNDEILDISSKKQMTENKDKKSVEVVTNKNTQSMVPAEAAELENLTKAQSSGLIMSPHDNSDDKSIPEGNEWTTLDSVGFVDENTQSDITDVIAPSPNIFKNPDEIVQSTTLTEQSSYLEDIESDIEEFTPRNHHHEDDQEQIIQRQKFLLADWQDSPAESDHITESFNDENDNAEGTLVSKKLLELPSTSLKNSVINLATENDKKTKSVTDKPVIISPTSTPVISEEVSIPVKVINEESKSKQNLSEESTKQKIKKTHVEKVKRSKSTVKELEKHKSIIGEIVSYKSAVKELEDTESQDDENDNRRGRKRGRPPKRVKDRTRGSSRQSNASSKASRSRSRSLRIGKSPSSRDVSPPELERNNKKRPASGESASSNTSRRRSNPTLIIAETVSDSRPTRRGRKRKIKEDDEEEQVERTREEMMNCKVTLMDCRLTYLQPNLDPKVLQEIGISKINIPKPKSRPQTPEALLDDSIIIDEDKTRSDDESVEIFQIETEDIQSIASSAGSNIGGRGDPLCLSASGSSEHISTRHEEINLEEEDEELMVINQENQELSESRKMQYTVHKGPILDIKVIKICTHRLRNY